MLIRARRALESPGAASEPNVAPMGVATAAGAVPGMAGAAAPGPVVAREEWTVHRFLAAALVFTLLAACSAGREASSGSDSSAAARPRPAAPAATDSVGRALADLDARIAPLGAALDSALSAIRGDSGTARADSAFAAFRGQFELRAESAGVLIGASPLLQRWVYPVGREGYATLDSGAADSLRRYLAPRGLLPQTSEGMLFATANTARLAELFERFLSPPLRGFLSLRRAEESEGFSEDAGLLISWDRLGERVAAWESFISSNPGFQLLPEARYWHDLYLRTYLTGMDNSRVFRNPEGTLEPRVRASYLRYAARHSSMRSGTIVAQYVAMLERNGFKDGPHVAAFLRDRGIGTMIGVQPPAR